MNARSLSGATALHVSVSGGSVECLEMIAHAEPTLVHVRDNDGDTPLAWATLEREIQCALELLDLGANRADLRGSPPTWLVVVFERRRRCHDAALALYGVLRKRWTVMRVPRDMITLLAQMIWNTRRDLAWMTKLH